MNKTYRTVYNETTGTWVAVEETAKSHRKGNGAVVDETAFDDASISLGGGKFADDDGRGLFLTAGVSANVANGTQKALKNHHSFEENILSGSLKTVSDKRSATFSLKRAAASITTALAFFSLPLATQTAWAGDVVQSGQNATAIGNSAIAIGSGNSDDTQNGAYANGDGNIAIGKRAEAISATFDNYKDTQGYIYFEQVDDADPDGHEYTYNRKLTSGYSQQIAIGDNASAYGNQAIAIGSNTITTGYAGIAIGGDDIGLVLSDTDKRGEKIVESLKALRDELKYAGYEQSLVLNRSISTAYNLSSKTEDALIDITASTGDASMALGQKAVAQGILSNALGTGARTFADNSIAFGTMVVSGAQNSIAMGTVALTGKKSENAVAIGYMSQVGGKLENYDLTKLNIKVKDSGKGNYSVNGVTNTFSSIEASGSGTNSVAIGEKNKVLGSNSTAVGQGNIILGNNSGAFGDPNVIVDGGDGSYVVGNNNIVAAKNVFVLGNDVTSTAENSVFLGDSSAYVKAKDNLTDDDAGSTAGVENYSNNLKDITDINGTKVFTTEQLKFAGGSNVAGVISVGDKDKERRIQNVAAGLIDANSTDAINGSQLYSVVQNLTPLVAKNPVTAENGLAKLGDITTYTDKDGNPLTKDGDKYLNADGSEYIGDANDVTTTITPANGNKLVTAGDVVDTINSVYWTALDGNDDGSTDAKKGYQVKAGNQVVFKSSDQSVNVNRTDNTFDFTVAKSPIEANNGVAKLGDTYTDTEGNPLTKNGDKYFDTNGDEYTGNVTTTPVDGNKVVTAGDVVNTINSVYWKVNGKNSDAVADANADRTASQEIKAGNEVELIAGKGLKLDQNTENGITSFTFSADISELPDLPQQAVVYTDAEGNKLVQVGDKWYKPGDLKDDGTPKDDVTGVNNGDVIASMNNAGDSTTTPMTLSNIASNLPTTTSSTKSQEAPTNVANNNAATVGDVLNAGWNLQVANTPVDFVTHGDTVSFVNGTGTTVSYKDGNIAYNISKAADPVIPTTGDNKGTVTKPAAGNTYWDAQQVADVINSSAWLVSSTNRAGVKHDGSLVKSGNEVEFIAGNGIDISQEGNKLTFTAKIVDAEGKPLTVNKNGEYVVVGGGSGSAPFTIATDNQDPTTINGISGTEGSGVTFKGDENISVTKQPTAGGDGTDVQFGLNDVVNIGGSPDANNPNKPVTIDGKEGNITFNGDNNTAPVTVSNQDGNLSVGDTKIVNMKPGENPTDGVNVSQVIDIFGAANTTPSTDENGNAINIISTTGADGKEYTLKTYNVQDKGEYLTNNVVEAVSKMNEQGIKFFHTNDGEQKPVAQNHNSVDASASGVYATAIGYKATASGESSIALGNGATASGTQSISIGTGNIVSGNRSGAFGDPTVITGNGSYSVGNDNNIATDSTFAIGSNITNTANNSIFLGDYAGTDVAGAGATGTVSSATVGGVTYGGFAGEKANGLVAVGGNGQVRRVSGVAAGEISATSTDAINGSQLYAVLPNYETGANGKVDSVKVGGNTYNFANYDFVDGNGTTARVDPNNNTVTFDTIPGYAEGIQAGNNVDLTYIDNTDAAGNQLYVTNVGGTTTDASDPDVRLDANGNPIKQQTTVISARQPDLSPVYHRIDEVDQDARGGVAQAIATAGLPQAYLPGKSMFAVAGGHYKGEQGYAFGLSTISDNGHWILKATASGSTRKSFGGSLGAGYQW